MNPSSPEDAAAIAQAIAYANRVAIAGVGEGLPRMYLGHALIAEAMELFFECGPQRAQGMADGLMIAAMADQAQFVVGKVPDVFSSMSKGPGTYSAARIRALSGVAGPAILR